MDIISDRIVVDSDGVLLVAENGGVTSEDLDRVRAVEDAALLGTPTQLVAPPPTAST